MELREAPLRPGKGEAIVCEGLGAGFQAGGQQWGIVQLPDDFVMDVALLCVLLDPSQAWKALSWTWVCLHGLVEFWSGV